MKKIFCNKKWGHLLNDHQPQEERAKGGLVTRWSSFVYFHFRAPIRHTAEVVLKRLITRSEKRLH